jgi:hypothetical protein
VLIKGSGFCPLAIRSPFAVLLHGRIMLTMGLVGFGLTMIAVVLGSLIGDRRAVGASGARLPSRFARRGHAARLDRLNEAVHHSVDQLETR